MKYKPKEKNVDKLKNYLAKIRIDQMTREANIEVQNYISILSLKAVVDLIQKKLNDQEKQNLINQSIRELNTILKN